jgi:hypothetical protein
MSSRFKRLSLQFVLLPLLSVLTRVPASADSVNTNERTVTKLIGNDRDNADFFDHFSIRGLIIAAYA